MDLAILVALMSLALTVVQTGFSAAAYAAQRARLSPAEPEDER